MHVKKYTLGLQFQRCRYAPGNLSRAKKRGCKCNKGSAIRELEEKDENLLTAARTSDGVIFAVGWLFLSFGQSFLYSASCKAVDAELPLVAFKVTEKGETQKVMPVRFSLSKAASWSKKQLNSRVGSSTGSGREIAAEGSSAVLRVASSPERYLDRVSEEGAENFDGRDAAEDDEDEEEELDEELESRGLYRGRFLLLDDDEK